MDRPGCASSSRACSFWVRRLTSPSARSIVSEMTRIVAASATVSPMPMENPRCRSQWLVRYCACDRNARAASGPASFQITCTSDPALAPSVRLHSVPMTSSPPWMSTWASVGDRSATSPSRYQDAVRRQLTAGRMVEMTCLPVHSGRGLSTAGRGTRPSQSSSHMRMFMNRSCGEGERGGGEGGRPGSRGGARARRARRWGPPPPPPPPPGGTGPPGGGGRPPARGGGWGARGAGGGGGPPGARGGGAGGAGGPRPPPPPAPRAFSMNVSRLVMSRHPSRVSWTMPMTGLLACGDTMLRGTAITSAASARVSALCGTCMFISSPSKSAL